MGRINPLVAIGVPTWGKVSITWARAYRHLGGPLGAVMMELEPVIGKTIAAARNELLASAIANKADFLFFLGDDVLAPGDTITKLLHRMWANPDVHLVTGVYWTKQWPTAPYLWNGMQRGPYLDWTLGEYFPIDWAGCDCLMIRLSDEIKALGPEWFSTSWSWEDGQPSDDLATEDFYFYTRAREAGIKLMCDTEVQCIHEDRDSGAQYGLLVGMPQAGGEEPELPDAKTDEAPLVKIADIGAGVESPYFGRPDRCKVVRFDGNAQVRPDYRCDIRRLPVADQSFDVVHARHVLEHFGRDEVVSVINEWARILRVGGEFRIAVPNLLWAITQIQKQDAEEIAPHPYPWWQVYGQQLDHYDAHKNGFTARKLKLLLEGFETLKDIEVIEGDEGMNLYARAIKAKHAGGYALVSGWDRIAEQEQIAVPGLNGHEKNGHEPISETPVRKRKKREAVHA